MDYCGVRPDNYLTDVDPMPPDGWANCEGSCDFDWQCKGDLACYQRGGDNLWELVSNEEDTSHRTRSPRCVMDLSIDQPFIAPSTICSLSLEGPWLLWNWRK